MMDGKGDNKTSKSEKVFEIIVKMVQLLPIILAVVNIIYNNIYKNEVTLEVEKKIEKGIGVEYRGYLIKTNPSMKASRLGVQPYLQLEYNGKHFGSILIHGLYDKAYEETRMEEDNVFVLMAKSHTIENLTDEIQNAVSSYEGKNLSLSISCYAVLCVTYNEQSEKKRHEKYYLMNLNSDNIEWECLSQTEALDKINMGSKLQLVEQLDITDSDNKDIDDQNKIIVNMVQAIEDMRKGG